MMTVITMHSCSSFTVFLWLPLFLALLAAQLHAAAADNDFEPRCGDCWCVPEGGVGVGTCPEFTGLWQSFPDGLDETYASFQLDESSTTTSDQPALAAAGGGPCFPFLDTLGELEYAESKFPQCQFSDKPADTTVCGYKFKTTCQEKSYELVSYDNMDALSADENVAFVHSGPCGVCSNAQDFAVRIKTLEDIAGLIVTCSIGYVFGSDFEALISCYETIGFTKPCATLWSHYSATNAEKCRDPCLSNTDAEGNQILNLDPPMCELSECLACSSGFEADMKVLGGVGRSAFNAGFNDAVAWPCSVFARNPNLDQPCSTKEQQPDEPAAPEPTPDDGASAAKQDDPTPAPTGENVEEPAPAPPTNTASSSWMTATNLLLIVPVVLFFVS